MCGIIGYTGQGDAVEAVLKGLQQLEYRGYDSAGLAALENGSLEVARAVGRVADLRRLTGSRRWTARTAIGHTRWATHGRVSEANAHPHRDDSGVLALVHNGILENYESLRRELTGRGCRFLSETDTEVAVQLIGALYRGDLLAAVEEALARLTGSFAFAVVSLREPGLIVGARRGSLVGLCVVYV